MVSRGGPWWSTLPMEGVRVQSLIGELRAVQPKSKNLKKREREEIQEEATKHAAYGRCVCVLEKRI